jgi:hypothetical protein
MDGAVLHPEAIEEVSKMIDITNLKTKAITFSNLGVLVGIVNDKPVILRITPANAPNNAVISAAKCAAMHLGYTPDKRFKSGWRKLPGAAA